MVEINFKKLLEKKRVKQSIAFSLISLGVINLLNIQQIIDILGPFQNIIWVAIAIGGWLLLRG